MPSWCSTTCIRPYVHAQCDYDHSVKVLQSALGEAPPSVVAVIGCGCSTATEAVADIPQLSSMPVVRSPILHLGTSARYSCWSRTLQISYASSSTSLNNGNKYRNVFRTIPDSRDTVAGLVAFVDYFRWKQVMVITQEISATGKVCQCKSNGTQFSMEHECSLLDVRKCVLYPC